MKKRIVKTAVSVAIFCLIIFLMDYMLVPVMFDHWANHDRKKYNQDINTVVLSDSLGMYSFQPKIYDEKLDAFSFNSSSAGQTPLDSYYILKDFIKHSPNLKKVVFMADYYVFREEQTFDSFWINNIMINRIEDFWLKIDYIHETNTVDNYYKFIIKKDLYKLNPKDIVSNVKSKSSYQYLHYLSDTNLPSYYDYNGYIRSNYEGGSEAVETVNSTFDNKTSYDYFNRIIELCKENNIELVVVQSQITDIAFGKIKNYFNYNEKINTICKENGIKFYDYNQKDLRMNLDQKKDFKDSVHLNYNGSCKFMEQLCKDLLK